MKMSLRKTGTKNFELTKRDVELVRLLSVGMTSADISESSDLTVRTVETILFKIRKAYNCKNTTHLVAKFLREKIIK